MATIRSKLRRAIPFGVRWRLGFLRRLIADSRTGVRFASTRVAGTSRWQAFCGYERPLICYPGQEAAFAGKRRNMEIALAAVDGLRIAPGETFSFWHAVGRPTARRGYMLAAALRRGELTQDIGGALCLASTLLYNVALRGGMEIVERRCHSVDSYGEARYFELGLDAAVEFAYIDLRFQNPLPVAVRLRTHAGAECVTAELSAPGPVRLEVEISVSEPQVIGQRIRVRTQRRVTRDGHTRCEDLGWSEHRAPWLEECGTARLIEARLIGSGSCASGPEHTAGRRDGRAGEDV